MKIYTLAWKQPNFVGPTSNDCYKTRRQHIKQPFVCKLLRDGRHVFTLAHALVFMEFENLIHPINIKGSTIVCCSCFLVTHHHLSCQRSIIFMHTRIFVLVDSDVRIQYTTDCILAHNSFHNLLLIN